MIAESMYGDASPTWWLEKLADRFGAFEAAAYATIELARHVTEDELAMDVHLAEAILEFGADLRVANKGAECWTCSRRQRAAVPTDLA